MLFKLSSMPFLTSFKSLGSSKFRFWSIAFIKADWTVSDISNCDTCLTSLLFLLVKFIFCKKKVKQLQFLVFSISSEIPNYVLSTYVRNSWKFISIFVDTCKYIHDWSACVIIKCISVDEINFLEKRQYNRASI